MTETTLLKPENTILNSPPAPAESPVVALIRSRQQLQADPENATALFEQAVALCRLGQWKPALDAWEQVTRLEPDNAFAHLNRGIVHLQQEQWAQAEQAFAAALRCAPEHAEAHFGLGMAYAHQERYEQAYAAWQEALRFDPAHPEAHANLAMLAQMSGTEVEFLNFGSAQTLQFDCVVASREPVPSEERRIKLPPLSGPPLGPIAETVVAAQEARTQEGNAERTPPISDVPDVEARPEPTLKLDARVLKREHARLATDENSALRPNPAVGWLRSSGVTVGAVVAAVVLTLWGTGHFHAPAASPPDSHATIVTPSNVSANPPARAVIPPALPPPVVSYAPTGTAPINPSSASAVGASTIRARTIRTLHSAPASRHQADAKPERHSSAEETSRPSRHRHEPSGVAVSSPAPRRPLARPRPAQSDEDTFAAHHRAGHADNSEEWTDRIP